MTKKLVVDKKIFAQRLKELMDEFNETVYSIAEVVHLTAPTISRYLNADMAAKITTIEVLARYFNVNPVWLMGGNVAKELEEPTNATTIVSHLSEGKNSKKSTTSDRLKEIMRNRKLRQIDILEMTKPYCEKHNVKMNKSDISQYVSGIVEPGQEKLSILGMALNVSEAWLMGYNVPMDRDYVSTANMGVVTLREVKLINDFRKLNEIGQKEAAKRIEELTHIDKYTEKDESYLLPNAAHEIEGASEEDKAHDDAIMDDDDF